MIDNNGMPVFPSATLTEHKIPVYVFETEGKCSTIKVEKGIIKYIHLNINADIEKYDNLSGTDYDKMEMVNHFKAIVAIRKFFASDFILIIRSDDKQENRNVLKDSNVLQWFIDKKQRIKNN